MDLSMCKKRTLTGLTYANLYGELKSRRPGVSHQLDASPYKIIETPANALEDKISLCCPSSVSLPLGYYTRDSVTHDAKVQHTDPHRGRGRWPNMVSMVWIKAS